MLHNNLKQYKMSNSHSSSIMFHRIVDIQNKKEVIDFFNDILSIDGDLSENEDYFRPDTIKLGFENEVERHVHKVTNRIKEYNHKTFDKSLGKIVDILGGQEYWGYCTYDIIELENNKVSVAVLIGGDAGHY